MVSTNSSKTFENELIESNTTYREVRISTVHRPYGDPGIRELFAHIPHSQGNITLVRVSTSGKPKRFVISDKELFNLVAEAADYLSWQQHRNELLKDANKLLADWQGKHQLYINEHDSDPELFDIRRSTGGGSEIDEDLAENVPLSELIENAKAVLAALAERDAEEKRQIHEHLQTLKDAGFTIARAENQKDFLVCHLEVDNGHYYRIVRTVLDTKDSSERLLNLLKEARNEAAATPTEPTETITSDSGL